MSHKLFLPTLQRIDVVRPSMFGGEYSDTGEIDAALDFARDAQLTWARHNGIDWALVEPYPGSREWGTMWRREANIANMAARGMSPVLVIQNTARWARRAPTEICGPITPEYLDEYAAFVADAVRRYSAPPFNVRHYELYNEPDIDPNAIGGGAGGLGLMGCWGDRDDPYYGGHQYAEMLKRVYPAVKAADPRAQLLVGGLLLFCDPTNPGTSQDGCHSGRFLEGILRNGGGAYFDMVSYHAYPMWRRAREDWDLIYGPWAHRGGVVLGKLDFIRTTLAQYGVSKPVLLSEGGLLCYQEGTCPTALIQADQANYAVRLYSRAMANGLSGVLWFTVNGPGWREGGLLDGSQTPRATYYTIKFLASRLSHAEYVGTERHGDLEGYTFRKGNLVYRIYWTNRDAPVGLPLVPGSRVYNQYGTDITPPGSTVTVSFNPVIIESAQ